MTHYKNYYSWEGLTQEKSASEFLQELGQDGAKWAAEFKRMLFKIYGPLTCEIDEGWLIGWFANAIEAGRGHSKLSEVIIEYRCSSVTDNGCIKEYNFTPINTFDSHIRGIKTLTPINITVNSDSDIKFDPKTIYGFNIKENS